MAYTSASISRIFCLLALLIFLTGCERQSFAEEGKAEPAQESPATTEFSLASWNVLAEQTANGRIARLLSILQQLQPDVIAFQEAAPWFHNTLESTDWLEDYHRAGNADDAPYAGLIILSRHPVLEVHTRALPSFQKRGLLVAVLDVGGHKVAVATVHLDSPLELGQVRAKQLKEVFELLQDYDHAVLLGDYNFGDGEQPDTDALDSAFVDAWLALRPDEDGFTWNMEQNPAAADGAFDGEESRRLDRILIRSGIWAPTDVMLLGNEPNEAGRFPSDHFGLSTVLSTREPKKKSH